MRGSRRHGFGKAALVALAAGMVGMLAATGPGQEAKTDAAVPEKVVQEQFEAYNRHDVEDFLKAYSPENTRYVFPGQEMGKGLESMRANYAKLFADSPELKVKIAKRIVQGEFVIDQEQVSRGGRESTVVAIYRVKGDKITAVWFLK